MSVRSHVRGKVSRERSNRRSLADLGIQRREESSQEQSIIHSLQMLDDLGISSALTA